MRILFATTAGAGHFGPLKPFASACARAGHDVRVAGPASAASMVARAGLAFCPLGEATAQDRARFREGQQALTPAQAMARAAGELYVRLHAGAALPGMLELVDRWRPDVVVREGAEFASLVAAERWGVPHAQVAIGLSTGLAARMAPVVAEPLGELRARAGVASSSAGERQLTLAPASVDRPSGPPGLVERFRLDHPVAPDDVLDPWGDPEAPLVYVSFGTEVPSPQRPYFPDLYRSVIDALSGLPVRMLVTIGRERDPVDVGPVPPSVRIEQWVPNRVALHDAAAMVGHGGAGSVLGALAAGVPMALIALFADQPLNARCVADLGAGIALQAGAWSAAELRSAVTTALDDARLRARAHAIAGEIAALPPVDEAVDSIAALAEQGALA